MGSVELCQVIQLGLLLRKSQQALKFIVLSAHLLISFHSRWQCLRLLSQSVRPRGRAERDRGVNGNLLRLVRFQPDMTQKSAMCAVEIYQENSLQVLVVHQCCVDPRARLVVDGKVAQIGVPPK